MDLSLPRVSREASREGSPSEDSFTRPPERRGSRDIIHLQGRNDLRQRKPGRRLDTPVPNQGQRSKSTERVSPITKNKKKDKKATKTRSRTPDTLRRNSLSKGAPAPSDRPPRIPKSKSKQRLKTPYKAPSLPAAPPLPGWVIGPTSDVKKHYILDTKILGERGAMGYAVEAVNIETRDKRAAKIVDKNNLSAEDLEALRNEVKVMQQLNHKNVIRPYDYFETAEKMIFIMELCTGGELYEYISEKGRLPENEVVGLLKQAALAVKHMHGLGICHCDIKPDNFLFLDNSEDSPLKLIDFGTSKFVLPYGEFFTDQIGSPFYVAPEVLKGSYREHCDIWSIGCLVFVMLFGYPPFDADDINGSTIVHQLERGFEPVVKPGKGAWFPSNIPVSEACMDLVSKMLLSDTGSRASAGEILLHPWVVGQHGLKCPSKALKTVKRFSPQTKLRTLLLPHMVHGLSDAEREGVKKTFTALDEDGDGRVTAADLAKALKRDNQFTSTAHVERLLKVASTDEEEGMDLTDLLAVDAQSKLIAKQERLQQAFDKLDLDGDGCVTVRDLHQVLGNKLGKAEIKEIIEEVDTQGQGGICFSDFVGIWLTVVTGKDKRRRRRGSKGSKESKESKVANSNTRERRKSTEFATVQVGLKLSDAEEWTRSSEGGVRVDDVLELLPAEKAGIERGDLITKVNGRPIRAVSDFREAGKDMFPGMRAVFLVERGSMKKALTVRL